MPGINATFTPKAPPSFDQTANVAVAASVPSGAYANMLIAGGPTVVDGPFFVTVNEYAVAMSPTAVTSPASVAQNFQFTWTRAGAVPFGSGTITFGRTQIPYGPACLIQVNADGTVQLAADDSRWVRRLASGRLV